MLALESFFICCILRYGSSKIDIHSLVLGASTWISRSAKNYWKGNGWSKFILRCFLISSQPPQLPTSQDIEYDQPIIHFPEKINHPKPCPAKNLVNMKLLTEESIILRMMLSCTTVTLYVLLNSSVRKNIDVIPFLWLREL